MYTYIYLFIRRPGHEEAAGAPGEAEERAVHGRGAGRPFTVYLKAHTLRFRFSSCKYNLVVLSIAALSQTDLSMLMVN